MSLILKLSKCRLCLKLGDFYSIFASDNSIQLANMAMACSDIKIYEGDGLPDKICSECIEKLSSAFIFKQQCERSDGELRKTLINNSNATEISSYGRRNSDSGFSNRTDGSSSKKDVQKRGKKSDTEKNNYSSETPLLRESYSVDIPDPLSYEEIQHHNAAKPSSARNSPAIGEVAKFQCEKCKKTYQSANSLRNHCCKRYLEDSDDNEISSQDSFKIVKTESIIKQPDKPLSCNVCGQQFKYNIMLKRHSLVCKPRKLPVDVVSNFRKEASALIPRDCLQCPICSKTFKKRMYLIKHIKEARCRGTEKDLKDGVNRFVNRMHTNKMKLVKDRKKLLEGSNSLAFNAECSICSARFPSHPVMFRHFQLCYKRRGPAPVVCKTCNTTYTRVTGLYKHIRTHHLYGKSFKAVVQPLKIKTEPTSGDEYRTAGGRLKCRECDKTFEDQSQLVMHLAAHMANIKEPAKSVAAPKSKTTPTPAVAVKSQMIECKECYEKFRFKSAYHSHLQTQHDYSEQDMKEIREGSCLECNICNRSFRSQSSLVLHKQTAHSGKALVTTTQLIVYDTCPVKCLICNIVVDGADKRDHNMMHMNKNEKTKNEYECPACHVKFTNADAFRNHIAQHNASFRHARKNTSFQENEENNDTVVYDTGDRPDEDAEEGNSNGIDAMDFCESVVSIKQEDIGEYSSTEGRTNNKTVNLSTSSPSSHPGYFNAVHTQKLVVNLGGFTCAICHLSLDSYIAYQEHINLHAEGEKTEATHKCVVCNEQFVVESHLKKHIKEHTDAAEKDPSVFTCKECGRCNKNYRAFIGHNNWHKSMKDLKCHICLRQFSKRKILLTHFKRKHSNQVLDPIDDVDATNEPTAFQCHICNKFVKTSVFLQRHVLWHSSKSAVSLKHYQCSQCSLAFSSKSRYALHLRKHNNVVTPFQCNVCELYFVDKRKLNNHFKGHKFGKNTARKKFKCPVCGHVLPNQLKVQSHIQRHHPQNIMVKKKDPGEEDLPKIKYICKICGKEFPNQQSLGNHSERHARKPIFLICSLCGKRNLSRKLHTLHIKGHMYQKFKDNPLQCAHCESKFVRRQDLHVHMYEVHDILETYTLKADDRKTLDSSKEYQCHVCFKTLAKESTYLRHLDYHNAMRCNYCLKYFNTKVFMDAHVAYDCDRKKVLNGSDPFEKRLKCSDCYKAFSLAIKLRCHLRTQHQKDMQERKVVREEPSVCDFCFSSFESQYDAEKHKSIHTRIPKYYGCKKCTKKFYTIKLYNRHMNRHLHRHYTDDPLKCDDCYEKFILYYEYSTHLKEAHNKAVDWLVQPTDHIEEECPLCKKVFTRLHNHLNYHEKYHCKKCGEYFNADYLYESHICCMLTEEETQTNLLTRDLKYLHPKDQSFNVPSEPYTECDFCFKPYTTSYTEASHLRCHTKLLQFGCMYCNKTFSSINSFKLHSPSHRLRHYKQNPLLCKYCGEKFIKYGLYIRHLRDAHNTKESMILRPSFPAEECKICKKTFINIHYHYRFHKQFQCSHCNKYILSERIFKNHICNDPNQDLNFLVDYDGDITDLSERKFDYSTLRHRQLDKVPESSENDLNDLEMGEIELATFDLTTISLSPDVDRSNQDMIVSIPDGNIADGVDFKPVISSTISLSTSCRDSSPIEYMDYENARFGADASMVESSEDVKNIVNDSDSSLSVVEENTNPSSIECIDID